IKGFTTINGQSDNLVDPAAIKDIVQRTFGYPTTGSPGSATTSSTLDVYNGSGKTGLAARVSTALVAKGYTKGVVASGAARTKTAVRYGSGADTDAKRIAAMMGTRAFVDSTVQAGHVEVDLGANGRMPTNPPATAVKPKAAATKSTYTPPASGMQGGAVAATNGIACVN
ncbi:MAG TPA: LytR C-terminal domain-containing protein, partial [Streptosporangiaceae bacterium]|nr:LytR C-terminal domain-containing protein [Streptosporangiaceae bacterium]